MLQNTNPRPFRYHNQVRNNSPYTTNPELNRLKLATLNVDFLNVLISSTGAIGSSNNFDILNANTINLNNNLNFNTGAILNSNYGTTLFSDVSFNVGNFFTVDASNGISSFNFYDSTGATMIPTIEIEGPTGSLKGIKVLSTDFTDSGIPGNTTINTIRGRASILAGGSSITITNNKCLSTSSVFVTVSSNDTTAILKNVTTTTGSFTVRLNTSCTANTNIDFFIVN